MLFNATVKRLYDTMLAKGFTCGIEEDSEEKFRGVCAVPQDVVSFYVTDKVNDLTQNVDLRFTTHTRNIPERNRIRHLDFRYKRGEMITIYNRPWNAHREWQGEDPDFEAFTLAWHGFDDLRILTQAVRDDHTMMIVDTSAPVP